MNADDDDVPEWANPLVRGPIKVDEWTTVDDLSQEFSERLAAILQLYNCDATPNGWRSLALRLSLDHEIATGHPAMRVITPVDRQAEAGGAEPGKRWWLAVRLSKRATALGSVKKAAKESSKATGLSVGRLQNLVADLRAGRLPKPREMQRQPWDHLIEKALNLAADRVESGHVLKRVLS